MEAKRILIDDVNSYWCRTTFRHPSDIHLIYDGYLISSGFLKNQS
jgi:hypothetical protein